MLREGLFLVITFYGPYMNSKQVILTDCLGWLKNTFSEDRKFLLVMGLKKVTKRKFRPK